METRQAGAGEHGSLPEMDGARMSVIDDLISVRREITAKLDLIDARIAELQPASLAPIPASQFSAESSDPQARRRRARHHG